MEKVDIKFKQIVESIERLEADKKEIAEGIALVYKDLNAMGYDVPTVKRLVAQRRKDDAELQEEEYLLETYKEAMGN